MGNNLRLVGVWSPESGAEWMNRPGNWNAMVAFLTDKFNSGLRVTSLQAANVDGEVQYVANVEPGQGAQWVNPAQDEAAFTAWSNEQLKNGLHLVALSMVVVNGQLLYVGAVRPRDGSQVFHPASDWNTFNGWATELFNKGLRLTAMAVCDSNGMRYSGVMSSFDEKAEFMTQALPFPDFITWLNGWFAKGYRLRLISGTNVGSKVYIAGAVAPSNMPQAISDVLDVEGLLSRNQDEFAKGNHLQAIAMVNAEPAIIRLPSGQTTGKDSRINVILRHLYCVNTTEQGHDEVYYIMGGVDGAGNQINKRGPDPTQGGNADNGTAWDMNDSGSEQNRTVNAIIYDGSLDLGKSITMVIALMESDNTSYADTVQAAAKVAEKIGESTQQAGVAIGAEIASFLGSLLPTNQDDMLGTFTLRAKNDNGTIVVTEISGGSFVSAIDPLSPDGTFKLRFNHDDGDYHVQFQVVGVP